MPGYVGTCACVRYCVVRICVCVGVYIFVSLVYHVWVWVCLLIIVRADTFVQQATYIPKQCIVFFFGQMNRIASEHLVERRLNKAVLFLFCLCIVGHVNTITRNIPHHKTVIAT